METPKTMSPVKKCPDAPRKKPLKRANDENALLEVTRQMVIDDSIKNMLQCK
jgi:hypothetical protein